MPSLPDTAVIILLGLLLFGPKGLAQIARQLGKLMGEFRRASNEFRMQMEEELRISEQADRQKEIAAVEAAAPAAPALPRGEADNFGEDHPHLPRTTLESVEDTATVEGTLAPHGPRPIAASGELSIMPPATGLPEPRSSSLSALIDAVPKIDDPGLEADGPAVNGNNNSGSHSRAPGHEDQPQDQYHALRGTGLNGTGHTVAAEESLHG